MQTTRGKFNISIETSTYSAVQYDGYDVATCSRFGDKFKLTTYASIVPPNLLGEFGDVVTEATRLLLEARATVNKANTVASLKDTYLKSLTPKYLVHNIQYDANGSFAFKQFWVAFFENRGGEWFGYSGSMGTYTKSSYLTERMKSGALLPPDSTYRVVDSIPTPIGYRLFDTTKNKWTQSAKNGITLFATADGYTPMDGDELRPWYGPSLVTE